MPKYCGCEEKILAVYEREPIVQEFRRGTWRKRYFGNAIMECIFVDNSKMRGFCKIYNNETGEDVTNTMEGFADRYVIRLKDRLGQVTDRFEVATRDEANRIFLQIFDKNWKRTK